MLNVKTCWNLPFSSCTVPSNVLASALLADLFGRITCFTMFQYVSHVVCLLGFTDVLPSGCGVPMYLCKRSKFPERSYLCFANSGVCTLHCRTLYDTYNMYTQTHTPSNALLVLTNSENANLQHYCSTVRCANPNMRYLSLETTLPSPHSSHPARLISLQYAMSTNTAALWPLLACSICSRKNSFGMFWRTHKKTK